MDRLKEAIFSMATTVSGVSKSNTAVTNPIPNFQSNSVVLDALLGQIKVVSEKRMLSRKGDAENKSNLRVKLIELAIDARNKLEVYASFTKNLVLLAQLDFSKTDLTHVADSRVREFGQTVYNLIQAYLTALPTYALNAATQTALLNAINLYDASLGKTGMSRAEGVRLKQQEDDLFDQLMATINAMELSLEIIRTSQPLYYAAFKAARKIILKKLTLSIRVYIYDEETGLPIQNASAYLYSDSYGSLKDVRDRKPDLVKKSSELGKLQVQSYPAGLCLIKVKKNGYEDAETTIAINNTERTDVRIALKRIKL